jgi:3-hydroxyisobutyrate dehydrogenase-like beta-hydroxyacid dehydrogenase
MELSLPCLAIVKQFYTALKAQGGGKLGTQALIKVLEGLNNHSIAK